MTEKDPSFLLYRSARLSDKRVRPLRDSILGKVALPGTLDADRAGRM